MLCSLFRLLLSSEPFEQIQSNMTEARRCQYMSFWHVFGNGWSGRDRSCVSSVNDPVREGSSGGSSLKRKRIKL